VVFLGGGLGRQFALLNVLGSLIELVVVLAVQNRFVQIRVRQWGGHGIQMRFEISGIKDLAETLVSLLLGIGERHSPDVFHGRQSGLGRDHSRLPHLGITDWVVGSFIRKRYLFARVLSSGDHSIATLAVQNTGWVLVRASDDGMVSGLVALPQLVPFGVATGVIGVGIVLGVIVLAGLLLGHRMG
jgi:hypothetical protein